jgi:hypothetical protein
MDEKLASKERLDAERRRLLEAVYELTGASTHATVALADASKRAALGDAEGAAAFAYLQSVGLLKSGDPQLLITLEGLKAREAANTGAGTAGTHGSSTAKREPGSKLSDLVPLVAEMRKTAESLSSAAREEALATLDKLKSHAERGEPDHALMTRLLKGLGTYVEFVPLVNRALETLAGIGA